MAFLDAYAAFHGKVAVVIGGAGGVGRAVTLALAAAGTDIATCDSDTTAVATIVGEVEAVGRRILSMQVDVRDAAALDRFYDQIESSFERLDIVVNIAGGPTRLPFAKMTRDDHASDIRLNYGYVIDSIQRALPMIREGRRGGSIVNFTTIEAFRGAANLSVYAGAKAATSNFSRALAVELGPENIRVNLIAPDTTPSRTSLSAMTEAELAAFGKLPPAVLAQGYQMYIPQKQAPTEEDLANAVLFLTSDLSRAITGATLHVDGGTMAASGFLDWPFGDGFGPAPLAGTLSAMFE